MANHIEKHANKGKGHTSYLSHHIYEEIIKIMSNKVMSTIIIELQSTKYFSISVDYTPDNKHVDQLCFTVRYVLPTGPVERFLAFIPMAGHKGTDIAEIIFSFLKEKNISIANCRGQSDDNASNMSGKYNGLQKLIKDVCRLAEYCPCCGHSLNLIGLCTVEACAASASLFSFIQNVYAFLCCINTSMTEAM